MKRILSAVLSVVLVLGMIPAALAASAEHQTAADNLYQLGLVSGTGTDANGNPIYGVMESPIPEALCCSRETAEREAPDRYLQEVRVGEVNLRGVGELLE